MERILIVDDEVIVRKWLQLIFQPFAAEFQVVAAVANGREAFRICRSQPVDIIITDMIMPDMDGMAFIQALREFDLRAQVIILSNYADFSLAQKGMSFGAAEYMLKGEVSEEELLAVVRRIAQRMRSLPDGRAGEPLFLGCTLEELQQLWNGGCDDALCARFDQALALQEGAVVCAACSLDRPAAAQRTPVAGLGGYAWLAPLQSFFDRLGLPARVATLTDTAAIALLLVPPQDAPPQQVLAQFLSRTALSVDQRTFSVGISLPAQSARELVDALSQACEAIHLRFYTGPGSLCLYCPTVPHRELREERRVIGELVRNGELSHLQNYLTSLCERRANFGPADIEQLRRLFYSAAEALIQHTLLCCPTAEDPQLLNVNPLTQVNDFLYLDDLLHWIFELIGLCRPLLQHSANEANLQHAIAFIRENYMRDLTLSKISEIAGYSPNYFCNIFKEFTGKSVSSYVTDVRVSRAKYLLSTTGKSVHLVAEEVGYESASYFIKVFRDATGLTPNQFRRQNR